MRTEDEMRLTAHALAMVLGKQQHYCSSLGD